MKKMFLLALVLLLPIIALAGMKIASDDDLENIQGQVGITLSMSTTVKAGDIAWEDADGLQAATGTTGAVILSGVTTPSISISNVIIDAGIFAATTTSYLVLDTGTQNIISGDFTVNGVIIGNGSAATIANLGKLRVRNTLVTLGVIKIAGH